MCKNKGTNRAYSKLFIMLSHDCEGQVIFGRKQSNTGDASQPHFDPEKSPVPLRVVRVSGDIRHMQECSKVSLSHTH